MLSHLRRGNQHEFDARNSMPNRPLTGQTEPWKSSDRAMPTFPSTNVIADAYPSRSYSAIQNPDLSRAFRCDAYLLAIVRIEDKRSAYYSAEVVSKLREKERAQSFINKSCSLFVTDRYLVIFDRGTQTIAESIPIENVDPACVHADVPDTLNDIFMYRQFDRTLGLTTSGTTNNETSSVVVFKCSNNEARILVDNIRNVTRKPLKTTKSVRTETRETLDRRHTDVYPAGRNGFAQSVITESQQINHPSYFVGSQPTRTVIHQTTQSITDYYKRLTEELNKCFDDIELFVRYLEALTEYTKELERDHRRKHKKSTTGLKKMVEQIPDDRYFVDILQKFKHSFNLLGELKHIIHNPNAPELVHYLLSPLQFIIYTLRSKHPNQLQIAQDVRVPALTKEAKDLLINCLTSKEHEILHNLGPAWSRIADESIPKFSDYRPVFFQGRTIWAQEPLVEHPQPPLHLQGTRSTDRIVASQSFTQFDERQQPLWQSNYPTNPNFNPNGLSGNYSGTFGRQPSPPVANFDRQIGNRPTRPGVLENYNGHVQSEYAWAVERKRAGAKIYAVKIDRKGQNAKELTVRRGELIEIEDSSKKWWRARNLYGEVGHVPNNIVEEIEIELLQ